MNTQKFQALNIVATGLCCPLGFHSKATQCAMRAGFDHFRTSAFKDSTGQALVVSEVPLAKTVGVSRLIEFFRHAIVDLNTRLPSDQTISAKHSILIFIIPEFDDANAQQIFLQAIFETLKIKFPGIENAPQYYVTGRAQSARALETAAQQFAKQGIQNALIIGLDSFLYSNRIAQMLDQDRLLCTGNSAGFIPGEACFASLVAPVKSNQYGMIILGSALVVEETILKNTPNRSNALTEAVRKAVAIAGVDLDDIDCRYSDQNGETQRTNEYTNAMTRLYFGRERMPEHFSLAYQTGEIGAASLGVMLSHFEDNAKRKGQQNQIALMHLGNDNGQRCVIVAKWQN